MLAVFLMHAASQYTAMNFVWDASLFYTVSSSSLVVFFIATSIKIVGHAEYIFYDFMPITCFKESSFVRIENCSS